MNTALNTSSFAATQPAPQGVATPLPASAALEREFGRRLATRLNQGTRELPHDITERLRAGRMQALARRKLVQPHAAAAARAPARRTGWRAALAAAVPLLALAIGLVTISALQDDERASELAEVDAALLTGDLPPAAYTDPGFAQFLRSSEVRVAD